MRPSTIILLSLTILFAAGTAILAVFVGPSNTGGFIQVLRVGALVTCGFGAACLISVVNRRRRDRLKSESDAHPGVFFVNAHAADLTAAELSAWSPGLTVYFPCDLGFDTTGITSWSSRNGTTGTQISERKEITGFDVFDQRTPLGSSSRYGIVIHFAPRTAGPGTVHLWAIDGQPNQDEYTMRQLIARINAALGD